MKKVCSRCKVPKDAEMDFPIRKKGHRSLPHTECYSCRNEAGKIAMRKRRAKARVLTPLRPA